MVMVQVKCLNVADKLIISLALGMADSVDILTQGRANQPKIKIKSTEVHDNNTIDFYRFVYNLQKWVPGQDLIGFKCIWQHNRTEMKKF